MEGTAASPDTAADQRLREKDAHLTNLIIQKQEAAKRIETLESEVADLRKQLQQATTQGLYAAEAGPQSDSANEKTALKNARLMEMSAWNEELIHTVEHLQRSLIHLEADSKAQLITLTDRLNHFREKNERLLRENDSLKARVGDDVLRQRQTNRIEIAFERARIAARVRAAGLERLEAAEANLMEAHDDVYHIQRWDAVLLPQRDVSFVFHFVSNVTFPLRGIEEFIMRVYQQFLFHSCSCCRGYRVGTYKGMEVFAFQAPADALLFAKECHEQLVRLSWSTRIESVPSFATISDSGTVLYRGPRIHTCIFACSPESYVDPVSGRYAFFGPEVAEAVQAAVEQAPIGEIAVNDRWAHLMCLHQRMRDDVPPPTASDVEELRECLGSQWDVVSLPGACHVVASLLPALLRSRRGVQAPALHPSRKYPCLEVRDGASMVRMVVKAMKGLLADTTGAPEESGRRPFGVGGGGGGGGNNGGGVIVQQMRRRASHMHEAVALSPVPSSAQGRNAEFSESAAQLLELFSVQEEKKNITALYRKTEAASAALERDMMESEDRFEISKHKTLDPSETAYVCTVDTGDDSIWKRVLLKSISDEQFESIRNTIRGHIHSAAKVHFGFLMNGNYSDVFTYVFREVEQALAFVSDIYIKVNRTGTKYAHTSLGKGRDVFLFRAGVASGPMSSIYRNLDNGVLKCTGPAIRLSGTLCDLAESGEILAMEDVIRSFYSKNENLADTQYNIVKQGYQFIGSYDAPAVVHSVLPRPFAYRRPQLRNSGRSGPPNGKLFLPYRSVVAALKVRRDELPRQGVFDMMQQQLQRMESGELARMSAEDEYERSWEVGTMATPLLRNPWLLLCQPQAEEQSENNTTRRSLVRFKTMEEVDAELMYMRRPTKPLAFFFCDLAGAAVIARSLPPPLVRQVWAHYNFLVQSSIREFGGYVAKTNSSAAYLVVFEEPALALEAARQIQLEMTETPWPEELRSLEQTLHVRDMKTRQVLFNGPRPQMAVHVSDQYTWRMATTTASAAAASHLANGNAPPAVTAVHLSGVGVEEAFVLGRHAHGGEIRLSRPLLEAVGAHSSGKLLLEQLSMDVVVAPSVVRVADGGSGRLGSAGSVSPGVSRGMSAATPAASRKGADGKGEAKVVKTNVYAEECVVSVPRQLEGRLPLILPSTSSAFGAAKLTEKALALAAASVAKDEPAGKDRAGGNSDTGGGGGGDGDGAVTEVHDALAEEGADDAAGPSPTSPVRAVPLPATLVSQHAWFVEPKSAMNPLPAAWRTDWSAVATEQPPNSLSELGLLAETRKIQGTMQELLGLFPAAQRQTTAATLAVNDILEELAPDPAPAADSAVAASGGAAAKKAAAAADRRLPRIPASPAAGRGGSNANRRSKDATASSASTTAAAARAASRATAIEQYAHFMDFTRCVVTVLANALDIGTDMRTPPPLALPQGMHASDAAAGLPSALSGSAGRATTSGSGGGSAGAQRYSRGSVPGRLQRGSPNPSERAVASSPRETSFSSLPSLPLPSGRTINKSPANTSLTSPPANRESGQRERSASQLARGSFRVSGDRPFQSALDYLDDGCRALAQLSGAELGRLTALPPAPPASKSKPFSGRGGSVRRN